MDFENYLKIEFWNLEIHFESSKKVRSVGYSVVNKIAAEGIAGELKHLSSQSKEINRDSLSSGERNGISPNWAGQWKVEDGKWNVKI